MRIGWLSSARDDQAVELLRYALDELRMDGDPSIITVVSPDPAIRASPWSARIREVALAAGCAVEDLPRVERPEGCDEPLGEEHWRSVYEGRLAECLRPHELDLVMLSGYMLVAGPRLRSVIPMLNLHPALPGGPRGTQDEVLATLIATRPDRAGAMVHQVTAELDSGPVVAVSAFSPDDLVPGPLSIWDLDPEEQDSLIRTEIRRREPGLVVTALREFASARLSRTGHADDA